jgi:hypothetical protein
LGEAQGGAADLDGQRHALGRGHGAVAIYCFGVVPGLAAL